MHLPTTLRSFNSTKITIISSCVLIAGILLGFILMPWGLKKMVKSVRFVRCVKRGFFLKFFFFLFFRDN